MKKVFVTHKIPDTGITLLRKRGYKVRVSDKEILSHDELLASVRWCDGLLSLLTDRIDREVIDANPALRVISNYAVGYDNVDVRHATSRGIPVTNTPGVLTNAVAEHTIALLLAIARRIVEADQFMRAGKYRGWEPMLLLGGEMRGKTLGIVGLGRIGMRVAEIAAHGLGMRIVYHDRAPNKSFEDTVGAHLLGKDELLRTADVVTLHLPLSQETRHFIGARELAVMKKSAYLINTSRGPVVDEQALVEALRNKTIAGAALDVVEFEPRMAPGLAELSNVIVVPHTGSATFETRTAMSEMAAKNIIAIFEGKKPLSVVNLEVLGKGRSENISSL